MGHQAQLMCCLVSGPAQLIVRTLDYPFSRLSHCHHMLCAAAGAAERDGHVPVRRGGEGKEVPGRHPHHRRLQREQRRHRVQGRDRRCAAGSAPALCSPMQPKRPWSTCATPSIGLPCCLSSRPPRDRADCFSHVRLFHLSPMFRMGHHCHVCRSGTATRRTSSASS